MVEPELLAGGSGGFRHGNTPSKVKGVAAEMRESVTRWGLWSGSNIRLDFE
jgi:hypothetical protein